MANIIDQPYLTNALGANTVQGLFDNGAGGIDATALAQYLADADAAVFSALARAGYSTITPTTLPAAATPALVTLQRAALREVYAGALLKRRGITLDTGNRDQIGPGLEDIADGTVPIPGYVPDQDGAVGGVAIADGGNTDGTTGNRGTTMSMPNTSGLF